MKSEIGYYSPLRLPHRFSGGLDAFNVSVDVPYELLAEGRLTEPYIYCKVLLEGKHSGACMIEYPSEGQTESRSELQAVC
jgi:hypothetical protein